MFGNGTLYSPYNFILVEVIDMNPFYFLNDHQLFTVFMLY